MTAGFNANPEDVNSVPIAAVYPPGSTGNLVVLQGSTLTNTDAKGNVSAPANFNLSQINSLAVQMAGSDGVTAADSLLVTHGLYNGTTVDQQRGNQDNITVLASGAVTGNNHSADMINYNARGMKFYITTGAFGSGASTITVTILGKDPVSGTYFTILQSASLTASSFMVLTVYPGLTASANVTANDVLPRTWRGFWSATAWGTGGSTLGISCSYIV